MINKKGYFFVVDALFAIFILATGIYIIESTQLSVPEVSPTIEVGNNILNLLSTAKIRDFKTTSDPYDTTIKNSNNTILEAIGEQVLLDTSNNNNKPQNIFKDIIITNKNIFDSEKYGMNVYVDKSGTDVKIYESANLNKLPTSKSVIVSRKIIFGYYEDPSSFVLTYWGPYTVRVKVWQLK